MLVCYKNLLEAVHSDVRIVPCELRTESWPRVFDLSNKRWAKDQFKRSEGNRRAIEEATANHKSGFLPHPLLRRRPQYPPKNVLEDTGKHSSLTSEKQLAIPDDDDDDEPLGPGGRVKSRRQRRDHEEGRLESILFRRLYLPSTPGGIGGEPSRDDGGTPDAGINLVRKKFANLMDSMVRH